MKIGKADSRRWPDKKEIFTPLFKAVYHITKEEGVKVGFIITGKVAVAAKRNRIRRLLSEAVYKKIEKFPKGLEIIFIINRPLKDFSYEIFTDWIDKILPKITRPVS